MAGDFPDAIADVRSSRNCDPQQPPYRFSESLQVLRLDLLPGLMFRGRRRRSGAGLLTSIIWIPNDQVRLLVKQSVCPSHYPVVHIADSTKDYQDKASSSPIRPVFSVSVREKRFQATERTSSWPAARDMTLIIARPSSAQSLK